MKKYVFLSILFFLCSLFGVIFLIKNHQESDLPNLETIIPIPSVLPTPSTKNKLPVFTPTKILTPSPIITQVQELTPTRIILPESGVEFPSQFLTLLGGIITLLGFLILL